jgi:uncharacterized membrane protein
MLSLYVAVFMFVGFHFVMSNPFFRPRLVGLMGDGLFMGLYVLVSLTTFFWMIVAFGLAPQIQIWETQPWMRAITFLATPVALFLLLAGIATPNPTSFGSEKAIEDPNVVRGILTITRHPVMCGFGLWAIAHVIPNGNLASLVFFGGLGLLAFVGMFSIDAKRARRFGEAWPQFTDQTSILPFLAAAQGRVKIDWVGISVWRVLVAVVLWGAFYLMHPFVFGTMPFPGLQ